MTPSTSILRILRAVVAVLFACLSPALAIADEPKAPDVPPRIGTTETIVLFDGKDLSGWKGNDKLWSVQDGEIVGKNTEAVKVSTYLTTDRDFSDFRLTAKV
jgi:hypothetical protein